MTLKVFSIYVFLVYKPPNSVLTDLIITFQEHQYSQHYISNSQKTCKKFEISRVTLIMSSKKSTRKSTKTHILIASWYAFLYLTKIWQCCNFKQFFEMLFYFILCILAFVKALSNFNTRVRISKPFSWLQNAALRAELITFSNSSFVGWISGTSFSSTASLSFSRSSAFDSSDESISSLVNRCSSISACFVV